LPGVREDDPSDS